MQFLRFTSYPFILSSSSEMEVDVSPTPCLASNEWYCAGGNVSLDKYLANIEICRQSLMIYLAKFSVAFAS